MKVGLNDKHVFDSSMWILALIRLLIYIGYGYVVYTLSVLSDILGRGAYS